ncbi:MAG: hypothetical protein ABI716_01465, partial [Candidatus Saccharibacteria bacterium]
FMIGQSDAKHHQALIDSMHQPPVAAAPPAAPVPAAQFQPAPNPYDFFAAAPPPVNAVVQPAAATNQPPSVNLPTFNPYPTDIQQSVIQPLGQSTTPPPATPAPIAQPVAAPQTTSEKPVSAGIMNLANNTDLSIETIAREAHRISAREDMSEEVVISLR